MHLDVSSRDKHTADRQTDRQTAKTLVRKVYFKAMLTWEVSGTRADKAGKVCHEG